MDSNRWKEGRDYGHVILGMDFLLHVYIGIGSFLQSNG